MMTIVSATFIAVQRIWNTTGGTPERRSWPVKQSLASPSVATSHRSLDYCQLPILPSKREKLDGGRGVARERELPAQRNWI
jgi:hypothetical protein